MNKVKKVLIVILILSVVGLSIYFLTKKKENYQTTSLSDCDRVCLNTYPNDWENFERNMCQTRCRMNDRQKMMSGNNNKNNWIDDMNLCIDQKCNVEKCYNNCDITVIKPVKPERGAFVSDEEFYIELDKYKIQYGDYLEQREQCYIKCSNDVSGECREKCCVDAKLCDQMKNEKEKSNCKMSCHISSKMKKN